MLLFFIIILVTIVVSAPNPPINSETIIERGANYDISKSLLGFKKTMYLGTINMPDSSGKFKPYTEVTNFTINEDNMVIEWYNKKVTLEFYDTKNDKKEKFKDKDLTKKSDLNFISKKKSNKGNYYFTHNMTTDKNKQPDKFGYDIITENTNCVVQGKKLICDEQVIDFNQAVTEQNLTVDMNNNFIEISGDDLSYIDPTVEYNFNATFQGSTMWAVTVASVPLSNNPPNSRLPGSIIDITGNSALDSSDNSRVENHLSNENSGGFIFNSSLTEYKNDLLSTKWTWEGNGGTFGASGSNNMDGWIWNHTSSNWQQCISSFSTTSDVTKTCSNDTNNDIVNSNTNETVFIMWEFGSYNGDGGIFTDYVKLEITYEDLIINEPSDNDENLNSLSDTLNISTSGYNNSVWYSFSAGKKNTTLCTGDINCRENQTTITFPRQGIFNLTVWGNKSDGTEKNKVVEDIFVGNRTKKDPINDTYIWQIEPANNFGVSTLIIVGESNQPAKYTGLLWFNMTGITDKTIDNATLFMNVSSSVNTEGDEIFTVHQVLQNWDEGTQDESAGASNWTSRTPGSSWNTAGLGSGTDRESYSMYNCTGCDSAGTTYGIDLIYAFQNWSNGIDNYGVVLVENTFDGGTGEFIRYHSYDSTDSFARPFVNVSYFDNNTLPTVTNLTANDTEFNAVNVTINFNVTDDHEYVENVTIYVFNSSGNSVLILTKDNPALGENNSLSVNLTLDGDYTYHINSTDSDNAVGTSGTYNFTIDTNSPSPIINSITPAGGSQTISFNVNASDTDNNLGSCFYSIFNSSGGIDGTNENVTTNCNQANGSATVTTFATFNFTFYANDSAGNENSTTKAFTTSQSVGGGPAESGGGGGNSLTTPIIVVGENLTWSIQTDTRNNKFNFVMSPGSSRERKLIFTNLQASLVDIQIGCEDITGNLCEYVTFDNPNENSSLVQETFLTQMTLTETSNEEKTLDFVLILPEDIDDGIYDFNLVGVDQEGNRAEVSVRVKVDKFGIGIIIDKFIGTTKLSFLSGISKSLANINIPNSLLLFLPLVIFIPLLLIVFSQLPPRLRYTISFILPLFISSIIILFLDT